MPGLPSPLICKYSRALAMTGNVHLKVASSSARTTKETTI